jgi:hypothetical protein
MSGTDALLKLAGGDKALARVLRSSLQRLAEGSEDAHLTWMARDALAGKFDLRQLPTIAMLRDEVQEQLHGLQTLAGRDRRRRVPTAGRGGRRCDDRRTCRSG